MSQSGALSHCTSLRSSAGEIAPLERALVIGAGVAGLQAARALLQAGFKITILEETTTVGGCWASCDKDAELQCPWQQYAFPDFPWPAHLAPRSDRTSAAQVLAYINQYAEHYKLLEHVRFNSRLLKLTRETVKQARTGTTSTRWHAVFKDLDTRKHLQMCGSHVIVATGLHTNTYTPTYPGQDGYLGEQVHARHVTPQHNFEGKDVLLVGNSFSVWDTLADCAVAEQARSISLLYRKVPWPIPTSPDLGCIHLGSIKVSKLTGVGHYQAASKVSCTLDMPLKKLTIRKATAGLKSAFCMKQAGVEPSQAFQESLLLGYQLVGHTEQWAASARHPQANILQGRVRCFTPEGVLLDTGQEVPADCVVFCTGFSQRHPFFTPKDANVFGSNDDGMYLYRSMIHPEIRNLAFIGCTADTTNALLTSGVQAEWLVRLMVSELKLPSRQEMHADIQSQRRWHRAHLPACHDRSAHIGLYTQHYLDQLADDMDMAYPGGCWPGQKVPLHNRYHHVFPSPPQEEEEDANAHGLHQSSPSYMNSLRVKSARLSLGSVHELDDNTLQKLRIMRDTQETNAGIQVSPSMIVNNFVDSSGMTSAATSSNGATPPKPMMTKAQARLSAGLMDDDLAVSGRNVSFSKQLVVYQQDPGAAAQTEPPHSPMGMLRHIYSSVTGSDPRASGASAAHTPDTTSGSSGPQSALGQAMQAMRVFFKSHWSSKTRSTATSDLLAVQQRHESCTQAYASPEPPSNLIMSSKSFTAGVTHTMRGHGRSRLSGTATYSNVQLGDVMPIKPQKSAASLTHSTLARHAALTAGLLAHQASEELLSPRSQLAKRASSPGRVLNSTVEQPHHRAALRSVTGLAPSKSNKHSQAPDTAAAGSGSNINNLQGRTSVMSSGSYSADLKPKLSHRSSTSTEATAPVHSSNHSVPRSSSRDGHGNGQSGSVHRMAHGSHQGLIQTHQSDDSASHDSHSTWSIAEELYQGAVMHTFPPVLDVVAECKEEEYLSVVSKTSEAGGSEVFGSQPSTTAARALSSSGQTRSNNLIKVGTGGALTSVFASKSTPLMSVTSTLGGEQLGPCQSQQLDEAVVGAQDLEGPSSGFSASTHDDTPPVSDAAAASHAASPDTINPSPNHKAGTDAQFSSSHVSSAFSNAESNPNLGASASDQVPSQSPGFLLRTDSRGSRNLLGSTTNLLRQLSKNSSAMLPNYAHSPSSGLTSVHQSSNIAISPHRKVSLDLSSRWSPSSATSHRSTANGGSQFGAVDPKQAALMYCTHIAQQADVPLAGSSIVGPPGLNQHRGALLVQQQQLLQQQQQAQLQRTAQGRGGYARGASSTLDPTMPVSLHQSFTTSRSYKPDLQRSLTTQLSSAKSTGFPGDAMLDRLSGDKSWQLKSAEKDEISFSQVRYHPESQKGDALIEAAVKQAGSGPTSPRATPSRPSPTPKSAMSLARTRSRLGEDVPPLASSATATTGPPGRRGGSSTGDTGKKVGSAAGEGSHVTWAVPEEEPRRSSPPAPATTITASTSKATTGSFMAVKSKSSKHRASAPSIPSNEGKPQKSSDKDNASASKAAGSDTAALLPARERLNRRMSIEAEIFSSILQDGTQGVAGGDAKDSHGSLSPTGAQCPSALSIIHARQDLRRRSISGMVAEDGPGGPAVQASQASTARAAPSSMSGSHPAPHPAGSGKPPMSSSRTAMMPAMCTDRFNEILSIACEPGGSSVSHSGHSAVGTAHMDDFPRVASSGQSKSSRFSLTGVAAAINSAFSAAPVGLASSSQCDRSFIDPKAAAAALRAPSGTAQVLHMNKAQHGTTSRGSLPGVLEGRSSSMTLRRPGGIHGQLDAAAQGLLNVVADKAHSGATQPQSYAEKSYTVLLRNMALGLEPSS